MACVINEVDAQDLSAQIASWWTWCNFFFQMGDEETNEVALKVHRHTQVHQEQAACEL